MFLFPQGEKQPDDGVPLHWGTELNLFLYVDSTVYIINWCLLFLFGEGRSKFVNSLFINYCSLNPFL